MERRYETVYTSIEWTSKDTKIILKGEGSTNDTPVVNNVANLLKSWNCGYPCLIFMWSKLFIFDCTLLADSFVLQIQFITRVVSHTLRRCNVIFKVFFDNLIYPKISRVIFFFCHIGVLLLILFCFSLRYQNALSWGKAIILGVSETNYLLIKIFHHIFDYTTSPKDCDTPYKIGGTAFLKCQQKITALSLSS